MHVIVCGKLILKIVYREQQDASPLILLPTHTPPQTVVFT